MFARNGALHNSCIIVFIIFLTKGKKISFSSEKGNLLVVWVDFLESTGKKKTKKTTKKAKPQ